ALSVTADQDTSSAAAAQSTKTSVSLHAALPICYSGFVGTDGPGSLGGTLAFDTLAGQYSDTGTYTVTPKGLTSGNYAISFVDGSVRNTTRLHSSPTDHEYSTASVDQITKTYGDPNPTFTVRYSGFVGTRSEGRRVG